MTLTPLRRWRNRLAVLGAGAALALMPTAAQAVTLNIGYDAVGTAHIASTGSSIALGPTTLTTAVDYPAGGFTGSLPLPGTRTTFSIAGLIPVTADVAFQEAAPIQGQLSGGPNGTVVTSTAQYYIRLSNIKVIGFPTITGSHCRTINPVTIPVSSPDDSPFDLFVGGELSGEFTIGNFQHCGLNTWLINLLIPGSGNTVELQLSNGHVVVG